MIQDYARPIAMAYMAEDEHGEDPSAFFRGLLLAIVVSVPIWSALVLVLTKIGSR
jgi:hypothetical protein